MSNLLSIILVKDPKVPYRAIPWSGSICQAVFKSFINFWCGTPLDTQSLSTLHTCNGNVLRVQSGSTTTIWLTLPVFIFVHRYFLVVSDLSNSLHTHGRPSFMVVPEIVCSRGCSAAPLTWGMWFHVCAGASGNGCSITHSVRDLPGEASGLDSEEFTELILQ